MRFVETPVFTAQITAALDDLSYRKLQLALLLRPEQGVLIQGSGGLRKLRWAGSGRGKRGGVRVIYFWHPEDEVFYMLYVYPKNEQSDLTPAQVRILRRLVEEQFK
jgi:hypothetical protein